MGALDREGGHIRRGQMLREFLLTVEHGIFNGIKSYGLLQVNDFIDVLWPVYNRVGMS